MMHFSTRKLWIEYHYLVISLYNFGGGAQPPIPLKIIIIILSVIENLAVLALLGSVMAWCRPWWQGWKLHPSGYFFVDMGATIASLTCIMHYCVGLWCKLCYPFKKNQKNESKSSLWTTQELVMTLQSPGQHIWFKTMGVDKTWLL